MRVHWLQHAAHEGLGAIGPWLRERGARVQGTCLHEGEPLPRADDFDWLVVMGGPMNIYEHERYPWLVPEKQLINDACVMNKKVLGICLGAQLLADTLGGRTTTAAEPEIGWFDVNLTAEGARSELFQGFPGNFPVFHWHSDTFALPPGSPALLRSAVCANQAFAAHGGRAVGLQFHLEVQQAELADWLREDTPQPRRHVQTAQEMLREPARFENAARLLRTLLSRMAAL